MVDLIIENISRSSLELLRVIALMSNFILSELTHSLVLRISKGIALWCSHWFSKVLEDPWFDLFGWRDHCILLLLVFLSISADNERFRLISLLLSYLPLHLLLLLDLRLWTSCKILPNLLRCFEVWLIFLDKDFMYRRSSLFIFLILLLRSIHRDLITTILSSWLLWLGRED